MPNVAVTGLIFAGGLARRMDGRDKGLLPLAGRPLLAHVLERFAPQVERVLVNANRNAAAYATFGHTVIADLIDGFAGPLAGLQAGLAACATPLLATVPCDAPLLPRDLVAQLHQALDRSAAPAAAAFAAGRIQPAFLLCRREAAGELDQFLSGGGRSIQQWLAAIGALEVPFMDASAFANINTPGELASCENSAPAYEAKR